ncbi:glycosyl transferases group 1 family protein [Vibrio cholerae]|uniref:glycosyltransferase family 4 protein n=1 Tax=Vibrio cholerae TaxID=666 RepID=UPI0011DC05FA|nr:glycosyltransferase family 4 protein [Vibrio cholerae]TXY01613.1 glycosyltransferase family 4 protein [Vibrio cholerae]BCN17634.1 putative glycosyltransferase [Vibrio cholerae]GIA73295.1 glycosyl transferases group 1 family protein [Vibrio cholerae]
MIKKKILVLAEYIGEDNNSTSYYWSKIVNKLNCNFDVLLITPDTPSSRAFSEKHQVATRFVKLYKYNKNNLVSRFWGQVKQTIIFSSVVRNELKNMDLVFSGTNPVLTLFMMAVLKRIQPFEWLVLVHDVFPNNLIPAGVTTSNSLFYRALESLSKRVYSAPDRLICIGRDMKVLLDSKTNDSVVSVYIPNWASTDITKNEPKIDNKILNQYGWERKCVVFQFFGNMGRLQGISNLLKSISLTKNENARFLFIGCGSESNYVERMMQEINDKYEYERVQYYGRLELEKNSQGLNACDVAFVTLSSGMYGLGVPSKAYFSMAADKPIIYVGDVGTELEILIREHRIGWYCEPDNPQMLASIIDKITDIYVQGISNKLNPRAVLKENFSEQMALDNILHQVQDLAD